MREITERDVDREYTRMAKEKREAKYEWIVIEMSGHYHCQRCGDLTKAPTTMMCFSMLSAMMMAYFEDHKKCKAKEPKE